MWWERTVALRWLERDYVRMYTVQRLLTLRLPRAFALDTDEYCTCTAYKRPFVASYLRYISFRVTSVCRRSNREHGHDIRTVNHMSQCL